MKESLKTQIAKRIVDQYLKGDIQKMTDVERDIRAELMCIDEHDKQSQFDVVNFVRLRIDDLCNTFEDARIDIRGKKVSYTLPRAQLDIHDYAGQMDELIKFFKTHIEITYEGNGGKIPNRKAKYNLYKKVDMDNNYALADRVLEAVTEKNKFESLGVNEKNPILQIKEHIKLCWKHRWATYVAKAVEINHQRSDVDAQIKWIVSIAVKMVNKMVSHILEEEPLEDLVCDAQPDLSDDLSLELDDRQRYYLIWSLWNYAIIQIFQQLQLRLKNNDKKFTNNIVSEIKELEKEHQQDNQINCSFVEGYWRYVKLTQIHNELFSELNKECNQGYPDDYIFIKEEDMYTGDDAIINDIDSVIDKELHRMFHSGAEPCAKLETFKNRMQTCKELLSDYCRITSRNPPLNDLRTWRAFYRTLYINPIEFDRKKIINLVRNVIQFPEKRDPKLLEKHYRVSVMFSIALREEYQTCGTALLDFMSCFYSLSLKRMYDDFPETGCSDDIEIKTMELSDEMEKVSEIMYSSYFQIK